jgi:hypothetical protein
VAKVGAWGRRGDRTDQIRVRHHHQISLSRQIEGGGAWFLISDPIRLSYEQGIQTFDTANVSPFLDFPPAPADPSIIIGSPSSWQVYSNGASEIILGKAIKQLNLPREEIVVMTKVR